MAASTANWGKIFLVDVDAGTTQETRFWDALTK
jgi:hypothetical protein